MPVKVKSPTMEQIHDLRNLFVEKMRTDPPSDPFHPVDIDRVLNADTWCQRFLEMYDLDMKESLQRLWDTCSWRKEYGANDLDENNIRTEYLNDGVIFSRNFDIDGKPLLIFKTKLHIKGVKDLKEVMRVVVYWVERIHRATDMSQITLFFDMAGTGLTSMDLDFIKGVIEIFKEYYPNCLNYILVFEMAWILNAAFKIIKGLLPAKAHEILKVITKKDLSTYVDANNSFISWGGNDDYEFSFFPEIRQKTPDTPPHDKKVHFANNSPTKPVEMKEFQDLSTPQDNDMLRVVPSEFLTFSREEGTESVVEITSNSKIPISFKVQTTSPDKFRVRPRCGFVMPGETIAIGIFLKPDHQLSQSKKDKFLIMSIHVPSTFDMNSQEPFEIWLEKNVNSPGVEQHRLVCMLKEDEGTLGCVPGGRGFVATKPGNERLVGYDDAQMNLERQLMKTQMLQWVTLGFIVMMFCFLWVTSPNAPSFSGVYKKLNCRHAEL